MRKQTGLVGFRTAGATTLSVATANGMFHSVSTQRCVGVRMLQTHRTFCGKAARDSAFVLKMNNCVSLLNTQPNGSSTEFFTETLLLAS